MAITITKREVPHRHRDGRISLLPRYVINYKDPKTGKRSQKFRERQKDAQAVQKQLLIEIEQGTYGDKRKLPTIAEAFDRWIEDRRGQVKDITLYGYLNYKNYIVGPLLLGDKDTRRKHSMAKELPKDAKLEPMLGHIKINELDTAEIRAWHKKLGESVGQHSADKAKQYLGTILALAAEDYKVNPPVLPRKIGKGRTKEKKDILTSEQIQALLRHAKEDKERGIYAAFPFLAGTRPSEQLGLLWSEVDFDKRIIRIRRIQERRGGLSECTKTAAGNRDIPMSSMLYDLLLEWKERCPRLNGELYRVFPSPGRIQSWPKPRYGGGGELLYSNFRIRFWNSALQQANLPHVTPHSARHSFISMLQAQGVEIGLVAKLAGHANATVTLGHYTQAVRGGEDAVEKLAKMFAV